MTDDKLRSVDIERTDTGRYQARNARGGAITLGSGADDAFTPVELLLAAIGGCTAVDVDVVISRRTEPDRFLVRVHGDKISGGPEGNHMTNLAVEFTIDLPAGKEGDEARALLPRLVKLSHDRLCTVSRTIELGTPVSASIVES